MPAHHQMHSAACMCLSCSKIMIEYYFILSLKHYVSQKISEYITEKLVKY